MSKLCASKEQDLSVPVHVIDLSNPPESRYLALAAKYATQIQRLTSLFDSLLEDLGIPRRLHSWIHRAARLLLRGLHSREESAEIRGIAKTAQVPMYLLVSFNVILDLLMGCTSGAARCLERDQPVGQGRMLHFRTLDWGMDPLRSVIVQLDFVRSKSESQQRVLASSITYVGFVGVLTGVRQNLSMSLNFRGLHNASARLAHFKFYLHHLLVLLGMRQSISSLLRSYLIGGVPASEIDEPESLEQISTKLPTKPSTAAYLVFSDGTNTMTMEKDYRSAVIRRSKSFIVITNHDLDSSSDAELQVEPTHVVSSCPRGLAVATYVDAIDESVERRDCIAGKWQSKVRKAERKRRRETRKLNSRKQDTPNAPAGSISDATNAATNDVSKSTALKDAVTVTQAEVIEWVSAWPTTNECTHFAAVLDPLAGQVAWANRYLKSVEVPDFEPRGTSPSMHATLRDDIIGERR